MKTEYAGHDSKCVGSSKLGIFVALLLNVDLFLGLAVVKKII